LDDYKYAREAARVLDAENFGLNDEWILNKDPENENISAQAYNSCMTHPMGSIGKTLKQNPSQTYLGFVFVSASGMEIDGKLNLLLNEYDKDKKFYKMVNIE
jgi:hypothetical protein